MHTLASVASRIRGILHNHPRSQYVRLTKAEAQAVIAGAPVEELGIDTQRLTKQVAARVVAQRLIRRDSDEVSEQVAAAFTKGYLAQELERAVETVDRRLAAVQEGAAEARAELRAGRLPLHLVSGSGWDQLTRELREATFKASGLIDGAVAYGYAERNRLAAEASTTEG